MTLTAGIHLGPYEIIALVGAGGMGEVYRARDTRLDRTVAIKVLPRHVASNSGVRQRFEQEARAVAALEHPHICVLHDVSQQDGIDFLVMEFLEGETIAQRLEKGALPLGQTVRYAIEIADALDYAHRHAIVHRDLKPGNIMLTKAGAKLLDFGLAKLQPPASSMPVAGLSDLPTEEGLTLPGTIPGTLQYMAPEQLEGKEIDARTDIFAFGAVVYIMVTGKKAFEGKSQASLISAIMAADPLPISKLQPLAPPLLDHIVQRCLAKDPDERWQAAGDIVRTLKWLSDLSGPTLQATERRRRRPLASIATALVAAGLAAFTVWTFRTPPALSPLSRFEISLSPTQEIVNTAFGSLALSPQGTHLVYVANDQLYVRAMDRLDVRSIPGTEGARSPFFSPDGQWIAFFTQDALKKVSVSGGAPEIVCEARSGSSGAWGPDDTIMFVSLSGTLRVSAAGGVPRPLPRAGDGDLLLRWPQFLPGGKEVLFTLELQGQKPQIAVYSLETGHYRVLVGEGTHGMYEQSGHLIFVREGTLLAGPFDSRRLIASGTTTPIAEGVMQNQVAVSNQGTLAYVQGRFVPSRSLIWVNRHGEVTPVLEESRVYTAPRLSSNGTRLALQILEGDRRSIWIYDLTRGNSVRLSLAEEGGYPVWTLDGRRVAFMSGSTSSGDIFWRMADGSGEPERLLEKESAQYPISFSHDGALLAYRELNPRTGDDIWILSLADHTTKPLLATRANERSPMFSPKGDWLAYQSDESGRDEIYIESYPGPRAKWPVSVQGGTEPVWGADGRELFYRKGNKLMVVRVEARPSLTLSPPQELFEIRTYTNAVLASPTYDVLPGGDRFLMIQPAQGSSANRIHVAMNWRPISDNRSR